jgi:Domain of unknown function (DUF4331)
MSHHLDTPLARQNGRLYIDDLYVFASDRGTVFVMDVNSTITGPDIQPGFHPEARYDFHVHVGGEERESLTFRVTFGEAGPDGRQSFELSAAGDPLLKGATGEIATGGHARMWAGRIADPFYIDLSLLAKVNSAVHDGTAVDLSEWRPGEASNSFAGTTVETIVLEISHDHPVLRPGTPIGVWCATSLATDAGGWHPINRAGHPMMWPIFWPDDTRFTYPANSRHPSEDYAAEGERLAGLVAAVVAAGGTADDPRGYGETVARRLFPDVLPYVVGTPATYGFAGFNGRTLADNAPEAMLSLVAGTAVPSGLRPSVAAALRAPEFPFVVPG